MTEDQERCMKLAKPMLGDFYEIWHHAFDNYQEYPVEFTAEHDDTTGGELYPRACVDRARPAVRWQKRLQAVSYPGIEASSVQKSPSLALKKGRCRRSPSKLSNRTTENL